jgi:hypothetical protein
MASPTTNLLLEKQVREENPGTWGDHLNVLFDMLDVAVAGTCAVSVTGLTTVTLSDANYTADQAKSAFLDVSGVLSNDVTVVVPKRSKIYAIRNGTSGSYNLKFQTPTSSAQTVPQGASCFVFVDPSADAITFLTPATTGGSGILPINEGGTSASTASGARTALGLAIGTNVEAWSANLDTWSSIAPSANVQSLVSAANYSAIRSLLGLVIGTNVEAWSANLDTWSTLAPSANFQTMVTHTFSQIRTDLSLVIGTNVQAWAATLDSWSAITRASGFDTFVATPTSANLRALLTDETGTAAAYFVGGALGTPSSGTLSSCSGYAQSTLTGLGTGVSTALGVNVGSAGAFVTFNGALGTPSSGTLTNATGLPVAGLSNLGAGVGTWLITPSSANFASAMTDKTGSAGTIVLSSGPTLSSPIFTGTEDSQGQVKWSGVITPTQIAGNTNDYAPTSLATASLIRLDSSSAYNLTGLTGGATGRILVLHYIGTNTLTITSEDTNSSAANRFSLTKALIMQQNSCVVIQYDGTSSRWRVVGGSAGASFYFQTGAPTTPAAGDQWIDSSAGIQYEYINDGNTSQWVEWFGASATALTYLQLAGGTLTGALKLAAGTTALSPLNFQTGTNETTPAAGDCEFDGVNFYQTIDTTSSRGAIPTEQYFHLTADGSTISTIANFFGATSNVNLVASGYYVIEIEMFYLKTTSGTVTWTLTNSAAPTAQDIIYESSAATGVNTSTPATGNLFAQFSEDATAARTIVSPSLTSAADHFTRIKILLKNGTGTNLKIQATASAGTITPRIGSWWRCRRISPNNIGSFAS